MARFYSLILLISSILLASAADKFDPKSRHIVANLQQTASKIPRAGDQQLYLPSVIKLKPGETTELLEENGIKIMHRRGNLALAFIPTDDIDFLLTFSGVERISIGDRARITLDKARPFGNVDKVMSPSDEWPLGWDGRGVVTGFCDIGFDPSHPNFRNPDGSSRVMRVVNYVDTLAAATRLYTPDDIAAWKTDNDNEYHATHVAGIMAGGYRGNDYFGIAGSSDIVATTSMLTDACILAGAEEIIDYANSVGKPAVINMSLGSYTGPHDGTSLFNQYLAKIGQEAIVCIAAGNEGRRPNTIQLDFVDDDDERSIYICDCTGGWNLEHIYGDSDFWSRDDSEFSLRFSIFDFPNRKVIYSSPWIGQGELKDWAIASPDIIDPSAERNEIFNNAFRGYFKATAEVNPENGRFNIYTSFNLHNKEMFEQIGRYYLTVSIRASRGVHVDGYADGYRCYFSSGHTDDFAIPNSSMSISDIACGDNVLVVGASCARNQVPLLNGGVQNFDYTVDNAAAFTGYGTLLDGRQLPHIAAPGCCVVSSLSTPFVEKHPASVYPPLCAEAGIDGRKYYWGSEGGTSMATPYVAGVVALWLQADPSLTITQIKEIATKTAKTDYPDITDPRWGAGQIDALAGLKKVLELSGIENISQLEIKPVIRLSGSTLSVTSPGASRLNVTVYSCDGRILAKADCDGDCLEIDTKTLPKGIIICTVDDGRSLPQSSKMVVV